MANQSLALDASQMLKLDLSGIEAHRSQSGTGKTYTITNLYLRHILDGKPRPTYLSSLLQCRDGRITWAYTYSPV